MKNKHTDGKPDNRRYYWYGFECQYCGTPFIAQLSRMLSGNTKSCGCYAITKRKENGKARVIHGHASSRGTSCSPTYSSWQAMLARCYRASCNGYKRYGGRGIIVYPPWKTSFVRFLKDMGERPTNTTLDRIDPNGNYTPSNCRWSTLIEQRHNWRKHATTI